MSNLHLVTGYAGEAHITSDDHGSLYAGIFGAGSYVLDRGNKLSASALTSNQIRVLDGDMIIQGRHVRLPANTYVDLAIDNGAQGLRRIDLIVARYTKNNSTGVEECNLVVVKGTPHASEPKVPEIIAGDILNEHAEQTDFVLYGVFIDGLAVFLEQAFEVITFVTVGADGKINSNYLPDMNYIQTSQRGAANGVAPLDANKKVPSANLPTIPSLSSSVSSTSTTTAANSYAVKQAYDKAEAAIPASQKNMANGVAGLDARGFLDGETTHYNPQEVLTSNYGTILYIPGVYGGENTSLIRRRTPIGDIFWLNLHIGFSGATTTSTIRVECALPDDIKGYAYDHYERVCYGLHQSGSGYYAQPVDVLVNKRSRGFNLVFEKTDGSDFVAHADYVFTTAIMICSFNVE